ncbi:MAG: MBL fold metallo-hydrolase [Oscillospiraceae bacterium]|nr:MBL fold metallo-hydrolase [Oscillospiraceae bacterium]
MVHFDVRPITGHITEFLGRFHERMYLVQGQERAALIDTGCGFGSLKAEVDKYNELPLTVLLTHGHQDHAMGAVEFENVYLNPAEKETFFRHTDRDYRLWGLKISRDAALVTPEDMLPPPDYTRFHPLQEGDLFELGGTTLEALACPGHTRGNLVFLDREHRILFSGDGVSNASFLLGEEATTVEEYREGLIRLKRLLNGRVDRILEGHGSGELPVEIIEAVIRVCEQVLAGDTDRIPYDLRGYRGFTAKARIPHSLRRVDGGLGNLIYREDKLWRAQLKGEAQAEKV